MDKDNAKLFEKLNLRMREEYTTREVRHQQALREAEERSARDRAAVAKLFAAANKRDA